MKKVLQRQMHFLLLGLTFLLLLISCQATPQVESSPTATTPTATTPVAAPKMMDQVEAALHDLGVPVTNVHMEHFNLV